LLRIATVKRSKQVFSLAGNDGKLIVMFEEGCGLKRIIKGNQLSGKAIRKYNE